MKTVEAEWTDAQGVKFYSKAWEPDGKPKAAVAFLHGLGEHLGRYEHVGEVFAKAGYALIGFDLRGHGRSGGQRGHTPSAEAYLDDIDLLLQHVRERNPGARLHRVQGAGHNDLQEFDDYRSALRAASLALNSSRPCATVRSEGFNGALASSRTGSVPLLVPSLIHSVHPP